MWKSLCSAIILMMAVALCGAFVQSTSPVQAQVGPGGSLEEGMIVNTTPAEDGGLLWIVLSTRTGVLAVYHIDKASGKISLRSVRKIQWDLMIEDFNAGPPSPREIQNLLNRP